MQSVIRSDKLDIQAYTAMCDRPLKLYTSFYDDWIFYPSVSLSA